MRITRLFLSLDCRPRQSGVCVCLCASESVREGLLECVLLGSRRMKEAVRRLLSDDEDASERTPAIRRLHLRSRPRSLAVLARVPHAESHRERRTRDYACAYVHAVCVLK